LYNPANIPAVGTLAILRAFPAVVGLQYPLIYLEGYSSAGDGGQGFWNWSSSSSATDNTGTIVNPVGNSGNGRWLRQFTGPLIDLWFGVVADGTTDNTTTLQNCENAANTLGKAVYYPWMPASRSLTGTITTYAGIEHWGDGMNALSVATGVINIGGSTIYKSNGTGPAYSFQTSTGTYFDLPAPSWRDMNIHSPNGSGITLNSIAGGFTDDLTSQASQDHCQIHRVGFDCPVGDHCVALFKCQSASITECIKSGSVNGFYIYGSDNCKIEHCYLELATSYDINAVAAGATFGNMLWIDKCVFEGPNTGAVSFINSNYRSIYIEENFLEAVSGSLSSGAAITLSSGISATIRNNEVDFPIGGGGNWLNITGTFANLNLLDNTTGTAAAPGITFNSGAGHKAYVSSNVRAYINASGPLIGGIPFSNPVGSLELGYQANFPPPLSGSAYWVFNPNVSPLDSTVGSYYQSVVVAPSGFYTLPAMSGTGSQIGWTAPIASITDTVDVWILGYSPTASQVVTVQFSGTQYTQTLTSTPTWYKAASAVSVSGVSSIEVFNADTSHGGVCYVGSVQVLKH